MFEKEAENYSTDTYDSCLYDYLPYTNDARAREESFKDGATFGYNKANEWHYPSKGEYPKEGENVLCCCKVVNAKFYSIGHTVIGGDTKIRWWASNRPEELEVYAWREIVFPEEVKENEN